MLPPDVALPDAEPPVLLSVVPLSVSVLSEVFPLVLLPPLSSVFSVLPESSVFTVMPGAASIFAPGTVTTAFWAFTYTVSTFPSPETSTSAAFIEISFIDDAASIFKDEPVPEIMTFSAMTSLRETSPLPLTTIFPVTVILLKVTSLSPTPSPIIKSPFIILFDKVTGFFITTFPFFILTLFFVTTLGNCFFRYFLNEPDVNLLEEPFPETLLLVFCTMFAKTPATKFFVALV